MKTALMEERSNRIIQEGLELANRYKQYLSPMSEAVRESTGRNVPYNVMATTAFALKSIDEWLAPMDEATRAVNAGTFVDYGYKLVTAVMPNLVADQICSIQPMKLKQSEVFYFDFKYSNSKGKISAGDTAIGAQTGFQPAGYNYASETIEEEVIGTGDGSDTTFSGNLAYTPIRPSSLMITTGSVTGTDNGSGSITGTGISSGTIDYTSGAFSITFSSAVSNTIDITATYDYNAEVNPSDIPQIEIMLSQNTVTARNWKLRALYTLDAAYDLQAAHGIDADNELVAAMASIIRAEIDQTIMRNMFNQASAGTVSFDATVPMGVSKQEHYDSFVHTITKGGNLIYSATQMVQANFIVAGMNVASIIEGMSRFEPSGVETTGTFNGPYVAGKLNNRWTVIKNPAYDPNKFLIGYKGNSYLNAGYIWAPYRPLWTTPGPIVLDDFVARRGLWTSGGQKMVNSRFYATGTVANYS